MEVAVIGLGVLFFSGHLLQWFFTKTKIPDLLILTITGYIIGPTLGWIQPKDLGQVGQLVSTLALIFILYEAGLQLSRKELKEAWLPSLVLSLASFTFISLAVLLIVHWVVPLPYSILLAFGVGSTSSAIVIPMVKFLSLKSKTKVILSLESAFTDIFAIVLFLVTVEALEQGYWELSSIAFNIGPKTLISMGIGLATALIWASFKRYFPEYTSMTFSGESWALLVYGSVTLAGFNGAMAVLCLGFTLANLNLLPSFLSQYCSIIPVSITEVTLLKDITFLLKTFFFIYLGTLISFQDPRLVFYGALVTLAIYITRYICVRLLLRPQNFSKMDALSVTSMGPRGLACAVLATIPLQKGFEYGNEIQQILFAVIPMSIFLTALFIFACENQKTRHALAFLFPTHEEDN